MSEQTQLSESEKKKEDWMNSKWRPMMGWLYMGTCTFDFVIFPILWSLLQAVTHAAQITQWQPLTLQGAGLYHIAMGAVLGLAAFGRTQEKLAGANNGGITPAPSGFATPSAPSAGFGAPAGGFGSAAPNFTAAPKPATSSFAAPVATAAVAGGAVGFGAATAMPAMDKPAPSRPPLDEDFPEID